MAESDAGGKNAACCFSANRFPKASRLLGAQLSAQCDAGSRVERGKAGAMSTLNIAPFASNPQESEAAVVNLLRLVEYPPPPLSSCKHPRGRCGT